MSELNSIRIIGKAYVHANPAFPDSFKLTITSCLPKGESDPSSQSSSTGVRLLEADQSTMGEQEFFLNRETAEGLVGILRQALDDVP